MNLARFPGVSPWARRTLAEGDVERIAATEPQDVTVGASMDAPGGTVTVSLHRDRERLALGCGPTLAAALDAALANWSAS